jgi:diguanylate cyclase (GGDEF)-like protein
MLRAAMAELSAILDPEQVMERLLEKVIKALPGDVAAVLRPTGVRLGVIAVRGDVPHGIVVGATIDPGANPVLARLLELTGSKAGVVAPGHPAPAGQVLGTIRCWLATPVSIRGERLGVLLVGSRQIERVPEAQVEVVATLAGHGMVAYENARLFSEIRRLATTDSLTHLNNRNHFLELARHQIEQARRYGGRATAVMIDIDRFKQINDSHGHNVGDEVIHAVAERVQATCRRSDVLCRYGGEEFALLTLEAGVEPVAVGERLRAAVAGEPVPTAAGAIQVTISVGVAQVDRSDYDLGELLVRADKALYDAKHAGRDRVAAR